jgi:acetyl esterase/lipase
MTLSFYSIKKRMEQKYYLLLLLLLMANKISAQEVFPLYTDSLPNSIGTIAEADKPTITVYKPNKDKANGTAIIIFPGGAYGFLATETEGTPIAKAFAERGITSFVIKYRLPNEKMMRDKSMGPLMDAQQSIKYVRMHAGEYGIDSNKIGIIGYSAGGHLASTLGTHYNTAYIPNKENINLRPDFMILVYPVISMKRGLTHTGSMNNLLGPNPSEEKIKFFSSEDNITQKTPPTYITHAGDDGLVDVENSVQIYRWLQMEGADAELHLYPKGNHGFTQRLPINEWLDPMVLFLKKQGMYKEVNAQ